MVDFITPETETSIWYFWGMARNFNPHDKALTASIREGQAKIFGEDVGHPRGAARGTSLERPRLRLPTMRLNIDMGGFEARRILGRDSSPEEQNDLLKTRSSSSTRGPSSTVWSAQRRPSVARTRTTRDSSSPGRASSGSWRA